ncbi:hypothetical protein ApDm4_0382 [Acetobacter pomorum]|nr:hypothetical protein ApDm4_0382 [Acetobacter pomorum]
MPDIHTYGHPIGTQIQPYGPVNGLYATQRAQRLRVDFV